jgi:U3 small nucleolar RNA-associated protein 10
VIPPLVDSLRRENRDPVVGAADLLLSFVAALQHMPGHRKIHLFKMLIETLGAQEFLFALLAMLADKYNADPHVRSFVMELCAHYDCETQLVVCYS